MGPESLVPENLSGQRASPICPPSAPPPLPGTTLPLPAGFATLSRPQPSPAPDFPDPGSGGAWALGVVVRTLAGGPCGLGLPCCLPLSWAGHPRPGFGLRLGQRCLVLSPPHPSPGTFRTLCVSTGPGRTGIRARALLTELGSCRGSGWAGPGGEVTCRGVLGWLTSSGAPSALGPVRGCSGVLGAHLAPP